MSSPALLHMILRREQDIFAVRQRGREAAEALGLEHQDQIRIATALSDVGRQLLTGSSNVDVTFRVCGEPAQLWVEMTAPHPPTSAGPDKRAFAAVGRLVDTLEVKQDKESCTVVLGRRLPEETVPQEVLDGIRLGLAGSDLASPLDELGSQNEHLLSALDEARRQRDRLEVLNSELEETNRGVMALYLQLTSELEETNRGVVALYAELDERSAQLRAASEAKTRFLANVSHELRAPVTAVIGLVRLLADPASDPLTPAQAEQIDLIRGSSSDLLSLVNDLLDLAKAESGTIVPMWTTVDLRQLFGQLRGTVNALLTNPEVELAVDLPEQAAWVETDEALLTQVLRNLLHNAVKFTESGRIQMLAGFDEANGDWTISVSDTGIGIPEVAHDRIFEEFYQMPTSRGSGGTGLGLPYARKLIAVLGGTLTMKSETGAGSTFTVVLPAARRS
jgi:signal transduction histidine kinase